MDNKLNWKSQIQHVKSKLSRGIGMLHKIRYYAEATLLKMNHLFSNHMLIIIYLTGHAPTNLSYNQLKIKLKRLFV